MWTYFKIVDVLLYWKVAGLALFSKSNQLVHNELLSWCAVWSEIQSPLNVYWVTHMCQIFVGEVITVGMVILIADVIKRPNYDLISR